MRQIYTYLPGTLQKTVAAAATPEALSATLIQARGVRIRALSGNSGAVYVGVTGLTASTGYPLAAGQELVLSKEGLTDLSKIFIRAAVDGEGVACFYEINT